MMRPAQTIEFFKVKKFIKNLHAMKSNVMPMIVMITCPGTQISQSSKMLADKYDVGIVSYIMSRVNPKQITNGSLEKLYKPLTGGIQVALPNISADEKNI